MTEPVRDASDNGSLNVAVAAPSDFSWMSLFEAIPDATTITTLHDGRMLFVNPAAVRMYGYAREHMIGRTTVELGLFRSAEYRRSLLEEIEPDGTLYTHESAYWTANGEQRIAMFSVKQIRFGGQDCLLVIGRDTTEYRRVEEALREHQVNLQELVEKRTVDLSLARDQADEANRAKSTFLANMSHELRTPLNAVIGYSEMLLELAVAQNLAEFTADLGKIRRAGTHLLAIISEILDISRIESGHADLTVSEIDIGELVKRVSNIMAPDISNGNVFTVDCPASIGKFKSDDTKVQQCLLNLVSNASKFTSNGVITLTVSRERRNSGECIVFCVSDTGIGIAADQLRSIFNPFFQIEPSKTSNRGGVGLGLAITHRLVTLLNGTVHVESEVGKGSRFTIALADYGYSLHGSA